MHIPVSEAKGQLTELVRLAEGGEEVVLTRHGKPCVRLVPTGAPLGRADRRRILERLSRAAANNATPGPAAARSQDFLYDEDGLPK